MSIITNLIRSLMFSIDQLIYSFIPTVYKFIMILANTQIFSSETLRTVANNMYAVIGIFVVFRLAFSLLSAIVNPDQLLDEKKGFGNVIGKTVIALILVAFVPYAFKYAMQVQQLVLKKGIVEKIIIGTSLTSADANGTNGGNNLAGRTLGAFLYCAKDPTSTGNLSLCTGDEQDRVNAATQDVSKLDRVSLILNETSGEKYKITYTFLISTVAGAFILVMLVLFCFEVALRTVKLGFLQIISPIAVISYVDPKSAEDGLFKKWLNMTISTYLNLFLRIFALAFMAFVIAQIPKIEENLLKCASVDAFTGECLVKDDLTAKFIIIFIIFGILMFAKEAPKILSELFGLKEGSLGGLNPFKKMAGGALLGGALGGAAALGLKGAAGLTGGTASFLKNALTGRNPLKGFASGFGAAQKKVPLKGKIGQQLGGALLSPFTGLAQKRSDLSPLTAMRRQERKGERYATKWDTNDQHKGFSHGFTTLLEDRDRAKNALKSANSDLAAAAAYRDAHSEDEGAKIAYDNAVTAQKKAQSYFDAYDGKLKETLESKKGSRNAKRYQAMKLYKDTHPDLGGGRQTNAGPSPDTTPDIGNLEDHSQGDYRSGRDSDDY